MIVLEVVEPRPREWTSFWKFLQNHQRGLTAMCFPLRQRQPPLVVGLKFAGEQPGIDVDDFGRVWILADFASRERAR